MRRYSYSRDVRAGCLVCHGDQWHWYGKNAQGIAARHHDATGHEVWVEVHMTIMYGAKPRTSVARGGSSGTPASSRTPPATPPPPTGG